MLTTQTSQTAAQKVATLLVNNSTRHPDGKWGMYQEIFALMDSGKITLTGICGIADALLDDTRVKPSAVIRMRRRDWLGMGCKSI